MGAHVDRVQRGLGEGERRRLDSGGRAEEGEDRAVVIGIGMDVREADFCHGPNGGSERFDHAAVPPLAHIRNALENRVHVLLPFAR